MNDNEWREVIGDINILDLLESWAIMELLLLLCVYCFVLFCSWKMLINVCFGKILLDLGHFKCFMSQWQGRRCYDPLYWYEIDNDKLIYLNRNQAMEKVKS